MQRLLLLLLLVVGTVWWISRTLLGPMRRSAPRPRGAATPVGGEMVRDRFCNTFLPRDRALSARVGAEEHYFCSERCRDGYLALHGS